MAQRTLGDGSTGDVVIRSGPPASVGGGGGGVGGSGGNRVGASGAFGGVSQKTRNARKRVKQEYLAAEAQKRAQAAADVAHAQEVARTQARHQVLESWVPRYHGSKASIDQGYAVRTAQLEPSLAREILQADPATTGAPHERWQLYRINKEKSAIDGLIARKVSELNASNATAHSFDGHDAFSRSAGDYLARLNQFGEAFGTGHQIWENAYTAAHEVRLLSAQINALRDKSNGLIAEHARWVEILAEWERRRQYAELREARIRYKQRADADVRVERVRQANTCRFPLKQSMRAMSALAIPGRAWVAGGADALAVAVTRSVVMLGEVAGTLAASQVAIFVVGLAYPSELGNGELTPEQRARLFHAIAVPANALELYDSRELQAIADAGGSVQMDNRLKLIADGQGIRVIAAPTGVEIDSWVPVVKAAFDPLTGKFTAEVPGSPTRYVEFGSDIVRPAQTPDQAPLSIREPQIHEAPTGVDWRIQDCIVCVPGFDPVYLSFNAYPMGSGVVTGTGQTAAADWWKTASQTKGAVIPNQIGEQFRGREFESFEAFDDALWRAVGEHPALTNQFEGLNRKRVEQGLPPYAPKNTWVGESREFELRYQERPEFWSDPFDIDKISIKAPNASEGWIGIEPAVEPWPIPPASSWKPLVPPGSEHLGSTTSPTTPSAPAVYPGAPGIPILPENGTFPAVDEGEIGASIPGFPGGMELPSPGLVIAGPPVEPLEVGPYNELSGRSRGDGLDIDHIPSRKALDKYIERQYPDIGWRERVDSLRRTPSIAIPTEVHRKFSETYGGRNNPSRQMEDATNLRAAVDRNFNAVKPGLLKHGFSEVEIESARSKLHELHIEQGWYE